MSIIQTMIAIEAVAVLATIASLITAYIFHVKVIAPREREERRVEKLMIDAAKEISE